MRFLIFLALGSLFLRLDPLYTHTSEPVKFQLLSSLQGTGHEKSFLMGLALDHEPGWKTYAPTSSEGYPPQVQWKGSYNIATIEIVWPEGDLTSGPEKKSFRSYQGKTLIPIKIQVLNPGQPVILNLQVKALACQTLCLPLDQHLSLKVPAGPPLATKHREPLTEIYKKLKSLTETPLWKILLLSLLGGLILNLMPCVLPVLSLKLLFLTQNKENARAFRKGFLWTFLGIISSFLVIGLMTAFLKGIGVVVGWGSHFQSPLFMGLASFALLLFGLNLLGFLGFSLPSWVGRLDIKIQERLKEHSHKKDFLTGMMATLLATPCSAPFIGTAVGYALTHGFLPLILIFLSLGLGFGAPYLGIALLPPSWIRFPKPGAWMLTLRRFLGVCMLLSSGWFFYGFLSHVKIGCPQLLPFLKTSDKKDLMEWSPFNPSQIPNLVDQGKTVIVDITADWCLTCHYNKKQALHAPKVLKKIKQLPVILMRADWTRHDSSIAHFMERHGRSGVPLTLIFGPREKNGLILPELLSQTIVLEALEKVS